MSTLRVGDIALDFSAQLSNGETFSLKDRRGRKNIVLYFYPKDFTSGCTKEACYFRDFKKEFEELDAEIIGVSRDTPDSHLRFSEKHHLNFPLISDPDNQLGDLYGVTRAGGRLGVRRTTFVIDKQGIIREIIHKEINMFEHVEKSLQALREQYPGH